jgi:hypothetical protein
MKAQLKKIMGGSFLIGMASIFWPSVIDVEPIDSNNKTDAQNIADYWRQVESYITKAYESRPIK